jgi:hypothetical protein
VLIYDLTTDPQAEAGVGGLLGGEKRFKGARSCNWGNPRLSIKSTVFLSDSDQSVAGPSGVDAQSKSRMSVAI